MSDQDQKLCDCCQERPGTNHICYGGQSGEGRSLCDICLNKDVAIGGFMQRFNEAVRVGNCKYCGAPAETAFGASSSFLGDNFNLVCNTCFNDLTEFVRRPENGIFDFDHEDEVALKKVATQFADLQKRQDEFIKQRVSERKSK
jgi:hypothetical protein